MPPSHARSGLALAAVSRADSSASVMYGDPAARASLAGALMAKVHTG